MGDKNARLFSDFPPVETSEWKKKIESDLKNIPYNNIVWKPIEGIEVQPFYREEDVADFQPYIPNNKSSNDWKICQSILVESFENANSKAVEAVKGGATSLHFIFPESLQLDSKGIKILLKDLCTSFVALNFSGHIAKIPDLLEAEIKDQGIDPDIIKGNINLDPIGYLSQTGNFQSEEEMEFENVARILKKTAEVFPNIKVIGINADIFHNAGATVVQEIGFSLAMVSEYLSKLTDLNIKPDRISKSIHFNFAIGSVYFMEIAAIRATRLLFAQLVKAWGVTEKDSLKTSIHCKTSEFTQSVYDPYVNILRSATQSMTAAMGGADSIAVTPFDNAFRNPSDFSERIGRNTQIILKEESYINRVADPAAGSYYIESLTESIAKHSWDLFLQIEDNGGYLKSFKEGLIQRLIRETASARELNIASRKQIIVGVNQYPEVNEKLPENFDFKIAFPQENPDSKVIADPLQKFRISSTIEKIRVKTELDDKIAKVFLLTYGNPVWRRARAGFATNFFGCGGFEIIDNQGFDSLDEGISAAKNSDAKIVVLCSNDDEYKNITASQIKTLGDRSIVIAGYPKDDLEVLKDKGIENYIHLKSNLLDELKKYQHLSGIV